MIKIANEIEGLRYDHAGNQMNGRRYRGMFEDGRNSNTGEFFIEVRSCLNCSHRMNPVTGKIDKDCISKPAKKFFYLHEDEVIPLSVSGQNPGHYCKEFHSRRIDAPKIINIYDS